MKKVVIMMAALFVLVGASYAGHGHAVNDTGDVTIKTSIGIDTLKVGDNSITIELKDKKGHVITGADVAVYFFMPSMPAMNYEVKASLKGKEYVAVIKPTMPGEWDADIKAVLDGKDIQKVTISFKAK